MTRFAKNPAKDRFLTEAEQARLLSACRRATWDRLYLLILMALTTGCRKGELLGLTWGDIDLHRRTAYLGDTKTGKPRYAPLTPPVVEVLMQFRGKPAHCVFPSSVSKTTPFDIKKQWANVCTETIGHCRFHDLRHTAASNLVRAGRTLFEVATLLGHSTTTMAARYAHINSIRRAGG